MATAKSLNSDSYDSEDMENENSKIPETVNLTSSQKSAMDKLADFIEDKTRRVFIISGYAGTGKTTLVRELIQKLRDMRIGFSLLASTGRAAKILSDTTRYPASTVHSLLYRFQDLNLDLDSAGGSTESPADIDGQLRLIFNIAPLKRNKQEKIYIYIIDEASMISDVKSKNPTQAEFGSGRLLHDLFAFDPNSKLIFVGDSCQLPPIEGGLSPALSSSYIKQMFSTNVTEATLSEIVRQEDGNDITSAAERIRKMALYPPDFTSWGKFPLKGYKNVILHPSATDLLDQYIRNIKEKGYSHCTLICRSNKNCHIYSRLIRPALGFHTSQVQPGDLLMITQNNLISGLLNGDLVKVIQTGRRERHAGLTFLHIEVEELHSGITWSQLLVEEVLYSQTGTGLTQEQQKSLLIDFYYRMKDAGIKQKSQAFKENMMKDSYLNALKACYGYAVTCHKAQGGEWDDVYLDIPRSLSYKPGKDTYQWLYTAITRAKRNLHIVDDYYIA